MKVLVDTNIWSLAFRRHADPKNDHVIQELTRLIQQSQVIHDMERFAMHRFEKRSPEGVALRHLQTWLKEIDHSKTWCGLNRIYTNDGNILWLCDEHRKLHEV
ncbi:MAG: hypothetical protein B6242_13735 [Anaerolineaceae bacterium 4572_78]|nr:MAG: hypothetical protein B6242_13735 [Anaerolineaceae bacterium 4572_78]